MLVLSNRLKALRINNKLTQKQLGIILNLSKNSISNYENEKRMISVETLIKISRLFNVELNYLVGLEVTVDVDKNETFKLSKEELTVLIELKKNKKLYYDMINNTSRTIKRIENKLYY